MPYDVIGREIKVGDYVFSSTYMYEVIATSKPPKTGVWSHGHVAVMITPRSKTSKKKTIHGGDCCVIPKEEYLLWLLKKDQ